MNALSIKDEIHQMANLMVDMVYSNAYSECLASITELSQMGMNATWADDIYRCFIVTPTVADNSISVSIDIDVGNEFILMTNARDKNLIGINGRNGQNTTEDLDNDGENWIQNDPLNIEGNLRMILKNIEIRCQKIAAEAYEMYKPVITDKVKEYVTTQIKEAIGE